MLTCVIRYRIDPTKRDQFVQSAADLLGRENYAFAQRERFLLREDRTFLKLASAPHGEGGVARA